MFGMKKMNLEGRKMTNEKNSGTGLPRKNLFDSAHPWWIGGIEYFFFNYDRPFLLGFHYTISSETEHRSINLNKRNIET